MIVHQILQGSDDWHKLRLGRFGSTDAQAVINNGVGLKTLVYKKVAERISGMSEDDYTNDDLERGKKLEDTARSSYELSTGNLVKQVGYIEVDEYTGGSPDGLIGEDGLIEIKCQKNSVFVKTKFTRKPDSKYSYQIQHLLMITDRKWCDFVAYNPNFSDPVIIRIERDEEVIAKLSAGLKAGVDQIKEIMEKVA